MGNLSEFAPYILALFVISPHFMRFRRHSLCFSTFFALFRQILRIFDGPHGFSAYYPPVSTRRSLFRHALHPSGMRRAPGGRTLSAAPSDPGCAAGRISLRMRAFAAPRPFDSGCTAGYVSLRMRAFAARTLPACAARRAARRPRRRFRRQMSCCSFIMSLNCIPRVSAALRQRTMRCMNISK